jgi:hypothetical protein
MIYYKLPTFNNIICLNPKLDEDMCLPFISKSIFNYCNETIEYIMNDCLQEKDLEHFMSIVHSYGYVYTNIPNKSYPISQLKIHTNLFYELLEILTVTQILNELNNFVNILHIAKNTDLIETLDHINTIYENKIISNFYYNTLCEYKNDTNTNFDFIFFNHIDSENDVNKYIINLIKYVMIILCDQRAKGITLIKINYIYHKPVIDLLYLLATLFEKVYIIKPSVSNMVKPERFILCSKFTEDEQKINMCKKNCKILFELLNTDKNILSLIDDNIPCYFINKINDINLIIGQQQLEALNQIIHILKGKNQAEKIEQIQKNNIQKSVIWCDKYMVPHIKVHEKTNSFLNCANVALKNFSDVFINENDI